MIHLDSEVPRGKRTQLGLYITAREAYEKWKAAPDRTKIVDVRTPEEFLFVGHPTMGWLIPVAEQSYTWDPEHAHFPMKPLPDFVERVGRIAGHDDTLLVMCRSGGRAAVAVDLLAKAGYRRVYNIIDGFEGDPVTEPDSVFLGQRMRNGWKNALCPWTCKLTPERMLLPGTPVLPGRGK